MKNKIVNFFQKYSSKWAFWVILAFCFKLAFFLFGILSRTHMVVGIPGFWGTTDSDTIGYLSPIDNFVQNGSYAPDYRMPGYGVVYLPFAFIFSKTIATNMLIIAQLVLSSISVYILSLTAKTAFKRDAYFYWTFFLYSISCFTCNYDIWLMTESVTTSFLIFSVYFLVRYFETGKSMQVILSGLFLTWGIFCHPVFLPFLLFFLLFLLIKSQRKLVSCVLFLLPFIVCDSAWIYHNYQRYDAIYPLFNKAYNEIYVQDLNPKLSLSKGENGRDPHISLIEPFVSYGQAWGAPYIFEPNKIISKRRNEKTGKDELSVDIDEIPKYSYTSKFNRDSLVKLVQLKDSIQANSSNHDMYIKYCILLNDKVNNYIASLKEEKPFVYHVKAPLILLRRFLVNSGSPVLFDKPASELNILSKILKIFFSILYYCVLAFAAIGIIKMIRRILNFKSLEFLIMGIALFLVLVHPLLIRFCCTRYLVPAYPFILVCSVTGILTVYSLCIKVLEGFLKLSSKDHF